MATKGFSEDDDTPVPISVAVRIKPATSQGSQACVHQSGNEVTVVQLQNTASAVPLPHEQVIQHTVMFFSVFGLKPMANFGRTQGGFCA